MCCILLLVSCLRVPCLVCSAEEIIAKLTAFRSHEDKFMEGKGMGGIYHLDSACALCLGTWIRKETSDAAYPLWCVVGCGWMMWRLAVCVQTTT